MKTLFFSVLICLGIIIYPMSVTKLAAAEYSHRITPQIFEGPDNTPVAGEWGTLIVPENRADDHSNRIEIPFIRFRTAAVDPAPPMIFLNGGPGEKTLDIVDQFIPFVSELPFDLILLEQRGVGHSRPRLDCVGTYSLKLDQELDITSFRTAAREYAHDCAQTWKNIGVDLSGYNVREMAADVESLRKALEYPKISINGGSFGSHHGISVLRYFEKSVSRAILSAVEGPNHTIKLPSSIQKQLVLLNRMVEADPVLRRHIPSFLELMTSVFDRLEEEPVSVKVPSSDTGKDVAVVVGKLDLQVITAAGLGRTAFLRALPMQFYAMSRGDFSWLGKQALEFRSNRGGNLMGSLVDCASGASATRRSQINKEAKSTLLGNAINSVLFDICDVNGSSELGAEFRSKLEADVPTLLISGDLDPRTPVSNAKEVLEGLVNGEHFTIRGVSHDFELDDKLFMEYIQTQLGFLLGQSPKETHLDAPFRFDPIAGNQQNTDDN